MGKPTKVKAVEETTVIHFNLDSPLERIAGESLRALAALLDYVFMGPGRSLQKLHKRYEKQRQNAGKPGVDAGPEPPSKSLQTLETWSVRFFWQERLAVWEKLQAKEYEQKWAERREQQRQDEWLLRDRLLVLANGYLDEAPSYTRTRRRIVKSTGQEIITLAPNHDSALKTIELASKLGRMAAGMDTERQRLEHSGPGGGPIPIAPELDLSGMDDEQLRAALSRLGSVAISLATGNGLPAGLPAPAGVDSESEKPGETDS